jgi:uncharacterized protein (TIGR04255 family)
MIERMHGEDLPRNPIAEVVFELRWKLIGELSSGIPPTDPGYKLMVGSFYERVRPLYPIHEQLPAATIPDEFAPYIVQHRFRRVEGGYPLVQVGPGILSVNDTSSYSWKTFLPTIVEAVGHLRDTYIGVLAPEVISLRYINAIPFDFLSHDVLDCMRDDLKVSVAFPEQLFREQPVEQRPSGFSLQSVHALADPEGTVVLKIGTADVNGERRLLWETVVQSSGQAAPQLTELAEWLGKAHALARGWFFTLIEGRIESEYRR